jgi:serine/threonine protein kinase
LGKWNRGGIGNGEFRSIDVTLEISAGALQDAIAEYSNFMIDFAFISIEKKIGSGSSAEVFSGKFNSKSVAVKAHTPPELTIETLQKIHVETSIMACLSHPNIVKFHGICIRPPSIGIVLELCSHGNLKKCLSECGNLWSLNRRIKAILDAVEGIAYLHKQGYIHRDVKTENFFVDESWCVKLGDFGECTAVKRQSEVRENRMTVLGTVAYMSPEIVRADHFYTEAVDVYALAITMLEILTGDEPYANDSTFVIYDKILAGERPSIPSTCPTSMATIIRNAWSSDVSQRPTSEELLLRVKSFFAEIPQELATIPLQRSASDDNYTGLYDVYPDSNEFSAC